MRTFKNIKFILTQLFKASPFYMGFILVRSILLVAVKVMELYVGKIIIDLLTDAVNAFVLSVVFYAVYVLLDYLFKQLQIFINNKVRGIKSIDISKYMRSMLYGKVKELDIACYENSDFYTDYMRAVNEVDTRVIQIADTLADLLYYFLTLVFLTTISFDGVFLLILVIGIVQHLVYVNYINNINFTMEQETTKVDRKINYIMNLFKNEGFIRESRVLQYSDYFINWNDEVMDESREIMHKYLNKSLFKSVMTILVGTLCSVAVIIYLCVNMTKQVYSPGDFVYLVSVFGACIEIMTSLFQTIPDIKLHGMYVENIKKVLNYKSDIETASMTVNKGRCSDNIIEFKSICFSYPGYEDKVLEDINIICKAGEKVAIVGENGCGKSTLIKLLLDFYRPDSGEIKLYGVQYALYNAAELREQFGVVFQDFQIYAFSIAENVLMRKVESDEDRKLVQTALVFSGLWEKVCTFENQMDTVLTKEFDESGIYLSGGEYQRLVIARAYARNAEILIFDEPCSALDPMAEYDIFDKLIKLGKNKTVIYVSHRLANTVKADRIFYMENGRIKESGTHAELMERHGSYCNMFSVQAEGYK